MKKRSVEVVESFCGWDFLADLVKKCEWSRDRELVAALFETGGRVSEVIRLETRMF